MNYKMFIDDERLPAGNIHEWIIVRSSKEAIEYVKSHGLPVFISFDHDLGGNDTSRVFIYWLIDYLLDNNISLKDTLFDFYVHSQNPIGGKWIKDTMQSVISNI